MTTLTILNGDFEILFDDETVGTNAVAGMRMIRRTTGASSNWYTSNELYSAVAENADYFQAMSFKNPMLPVTPTAYTTENKYFIPRSSLEYVYGGAITSNLTVASGDGVYRKVYTTVTTAPVAGDIGRQVTEATTTHTGTLLDYEEEPDGTTVIWIRPDSATDTFSGAANQLTTTGDGGTMSVTGSGVATSGETVYSSIQAIGAVYQGTEVYLYQNRIKMSDWEGNFQWWSTNSAVSLGIIDILVRVKNAGVLIADGDVEIFARQYTTLYDNFRLNVAAGGRSALPLASSPDINNTTGYRSVACTVGSGSWNSGNGVYVGSTWATATKKGVLTADASGATPTLEYYLIGDLTDFANTDTLKEYIFSTDSDGDATATAGTPAANSGGPTDAGSGEGGSVAITLGPRTRDHDGDGTAEPYSIGINCQNNVPIAKVYERMKYVCSRGRTAADLFGAGINIPGESYRGMEALFEYDVGGGLTTGDDILTTTGGSTWTARLMADNTTLNYLTVTDQQTSIDSIVDNDVIEDETSDTATVHAGGTYGIQTFTSPKSSPLGTYTGTQIFGARGADYYNPGTGDAQAYILTDDLGNLRTPPNTVSVTVSNTLAEDRIFVARDTGTAGVIDKDQFGGIATAGATWNGTGDLQVRVAGTIDSEVATAGWLRIVVPDVSLQEEHRYKYANWSSPNFNLTDVTEGTGVTTGSTTQVIDSSANFSTNGTEVGMLVRNTQAGKLNHVWEVTEIAPGADNTRIAVRALYGPLDATQDWDIGDTYQINRLIGRDHAATPADYTTADNVFDTTLDLEATGTSVSNTLVKTPASNYGVVAQIRQGKVILPYAINETVGDNGVSITVVRTPDTIAT